MLAASYLGCVSSHRSKPRDFGTATAEERCGSNTTTAEIGCTEQYADARACLLWSEPWPVRSRVDSSDDAVNLFVCGVRLV